MVVARLPGARDQEGGKVNCIKHRSPALFTSIRQDWATPRVLWEILDSEFGFEIDVCASPDSAKTQTWFAEDALSRPWHGVCWMNPPYGRKIGKWVEKAYRSATSGVATVVCLVPARTDTQWWHDYCLKGEIRFLRGRLCFDDNRKKRAPFPSAVVIFRSAKEEQAVA